MRISAVSSSFLILLVLLISCGNAPLSGNTANASTVQYNENQDPQNIRVKFITTHGEIVVELFNETPLHRDNFVKLTKEGFYDGLLFHRVIDGFMIQGGDPNSRGAQPGQPLGMGDPGYTLPAEIVPGKFHRLGALAAARMGDQVNPERRSSGSQFYIVQGRVWTDEELTLFAERRGLNITPEARQIYSTVGGTPHLDYTYTVFGQVISGLEVIASIAAVQTDPANRPLQDVSMRVVLLEN